MSNITDSTGKPYLPNEISIDGASSLCLDSQKDKQVTINLTNIQVVSGIVLQGNSDEDSWVEEYDLNDLQDGIQIIKKVSLNLLDIL